MEKIPTMLFVVAAALINEVHEILVQKRPEGKALAGLWEFPGGKVEPGESPEEALVREIREELGVVIDGDAVAPLTFASHPAGDRNMVLLLYVCHSWQGTPEAIECPAMEWASIERLEQLSMPPADAPFIPALRAYLSSSDS